MDTTQGTVAALPWVTLSATAQGQHLPVPQVEVSPRVRDKCSYLSFTDGEAKVQKSAFCLGPHNRPEMEL